MSKPALAIYLKNYLRIAVKTRLSQGLTPHYAQTFYRLALACLSENLPILAKHFDIFICPSASLDREAVGSKYASSNSCPLQHWLLQPARHRSPLPAAAAQR